MTSNGDDEAGLELMEQFLCEAEEEYIPKVGMTFQTLEEAGLFYKEYAKRGGFSTKIRNTNRSKCTKEVINQLITCNREGRWISKVPRAEKTNPICGAKCPAQIFVYLEKKTRRWLISKLFLAIHTLDFLISVKCWHNTGS
ncbi:hypothetical protein PIB30_022419 [Stylosanthes scabra]|uniref:FAR1 domain-containing protein n=1 Tax=Stylosanthes scabra TaxID=79078 RepID=A0ABU6QAL6_9FABA|nr:hypothetical protein [Stylosanthes scabra]